MNVPRKAPSCSAPRQWLEEAGATDGGDELRGHCLALGEARLEEDRKVGHLVGNLLKCELA